MVNKTFEEKFPSFKNIKPIILWNSGEYTKENTISRADDTAFKVKDIINKTIDKQKVKEVLENNVRPDIWDRKTIINSILEELGLED